MPRLLIADRAAMRLGIRMALNVDVEVCGEAEDAEQAIRAAKREQPDLCLIGDHIAGDGIAAIRGVTRAAPGCSVVVLAQVLAPHGLLIVSGIIEARRHDAEEPLVAAGLILVEQVKIDDWLALVFLRAS